MEKYGTIPDKFTKEWWDYIWYYYKWHFCGIALALFLIILTAAQCASRIDYDAEINYIGSKYYNNEETIEKMCADLGENISDVNENGKKQIYFRQLIIAKEGTPESLTEYNSGMMTKVALEFQTGESYLYLLSPEELHRLIDRESEELLFQNPYDYLNGEIDEESIVKQNDTPCAVSLAPDNVFLTNYSLTEEPLYLAVRRMRTRDAEKEAQKEKCENAVRLANFILGFK